MNKVLILIAMMFALFVAFNAEAQPLPYPYNDYDYVCYKVLLPVPHMKCEYRRVYDYRLLPPPPPRHGFRPVPPPPPRGHHPGPRPGGHHGHHGHHR